jgi:hypothetical protein
MLLAKGSREAIVFAGILPLREAIIRTQEMKQKYCTSSSGIKYSENQKRPKRIGLKAAVRTSTKIW